MAKTPLKNRQPKEVTDQLTLSDFVRANNELISVFGIFVGVAAFAGSLSPKAVGSAFSFLFLAAAILVWIELVQKFPEHGATPRLQWFVRVLTVVSIGILFYVVLQIRAYLLFLTIFTTQFVLLGLLSDAVKNFDFFDRLFRSKPGQHRILRVTFRLVEILAIGLLFLGLSLLVVYGELKLVPMLTDRLNSIYDSYQSLVP